MKHKTMLLNSSTRRLLPALVAVLAGVSALTLSKAGWSAVVDEITVTTRRAEEGLQQVPVAVSAFSAEFIEKQGITSTADVAKLVPGVQFDQSFSAADTRISMRGIASERGRTSTAVLVDGIDVSGENITAGGGSSLLNTRLLELERVEVIKGPQSALYGRNAFAGVINYVTKTPSLDEYERSIYLDGGWHDTEGSVRDMRGRLSVPLIDGKLALSVNLGAFKDTGAYINNNPNDARANAKLNGSDSVGGRAMLLWAPSDALSVLGSVTMSTNKSDQRAIAKVGNANTFYLNGVQLPAGTVPTFDAFGTMNYGQWLGTVSKVSPEDINLSFSQRFNSPFRGSKDEQLLGALKIEWDVSEYTFKSSTSYLDNQASLHEDPEFQDGIGTFFMGVGLSLDNDYFDETDTESFSQEFTLESTDWDGGNWLVGVSYFDETAENRDMSLNWFNDPNLVFAPGICGTTPIVSFACGYAASALAGDPAKLTDRDTKSYSVFGLVGLDLTEQLRLTAEARYIKDKITVETNTGIDRVSQTTLNVPIDLSGLGGFGISPVDLPARDSQTTDTINPRLALDFSFSEDVLLYASAAKGTKPAGFGTVQFARPQVAKIKQEKLYAYELGAKTTWLEGSLQANVAVYRNDYKDRQVGVTITDPASNWAASGIVNAAKAETTGLEVDLTWRPTDELTLAAAYSYTDAEWTDFNYTNIRAEAGTTVSPKDQAICGNVLGDCSGASVAGVPEHAYTLLGNYTVPIGDNLEGFINVIAQFQDERNIYDRINTAKLDSYWNVDAQIGVQTSAWSLQIYAENLFDDETPRWAQGYNDFRDGMYGGMGGQPRDETAFAFLPPPRLIGLRTTFSF